MRTIPDVVRTLGIALTRERVRALEPATSCDRDEATKALRDLEAELRRAIDNAVRESEGAYRSWRIAGWALVIAGLVLTGSGADRRTPTRERTTRPLGARLFRSEVGSLRVRGLSGSTLRRAGEDDIGEKYRSPGGMSSTAPLLSLASSLSAQGRALISSADLPVWPPGGLRCPEVKRGTGIVTRIYAICGNFCVVRPASQHARSRVRPHHPARARHAPRRSGAGVEPTEPWATRPHRF
jgi:hypothetical protein